MSAVTTRVTTRGVVYVHSTPSAMCPHITWALENLLGTTVRMEWITQPAQRGAMRSELVWAGAPGTGAQIASALRGWDGLRFEVTEEPSPGNDGSRWSYTPDLGLHHSWMSACGDNVINEDRLRKAVGSCAGDSAKLQLEMERLLGSAWDAELEPFRHAGEDAPVRWLHKVG